MHMIFIKTKKNHNSKVQMLQDDFFYGIIISTQQLFMVTQSQKLGTKKFAPSVVSGSSLMVAHMMATRGLYGR
jgi:hypothetical protein